MKRSQTLIIEFSPTRLELAQLRSSDARTLRAERLSPDAEQSWSRRLESAGRRLRDWVKDLGLAGSRAVVLYDSPRGQSSVFSCPVSAGRSGAVRAAQLAVAERSSLPPEECVSAALEVCVDGWKGEPGGGAPQRHLLVMGDAAANVELIADEIERSSLVFGCAMPIDAPVVARVAGEVVRRSRAGASLLLHVGEHSTILSAGVKGRLLFARRAALGSESFVDALTGVPVNTSRGESVSLRAEEARELLGRAGVSEPEDEVDPERGIRGADVLPLIRPALQRCVMEVRQSIRFGFEGAEGESVTLRVRGHGAGIPRLPQAIAHECGLALADEGAEGEGIASTSASSGAIAALAGWREAPRDRLVPAEIRRRRGLVRVRNGLWAGAAAALGFVALNGVLTDSALRAARERIDALEREMEGNDRASAAAGDLRASQAGLTRAERRMLEAFGSTVDVASVLAAVARATPESILLADMTVGADSSGPVLHVRGRTRAGGDAASAARVVRGYIDALESLPVVESCRLGGTRRADAGMGEATFFDLSARLEPAPARALPALSSVFEQESEP